MKIIKKLKRKKTVAKDPKKESIFKDLASILGEAGYQIRREKLRQGHGWRVASGTCRSNDDRLIFVDRRLTQDEQISFLLSKIMDFEVEVEPEKMELFPKQIQKQLQLAN